MTLQVPGLEMGKVDKKKLSKGERSQGKILFERNFGCISCHRALNLVGKIRGGVSGAFYWLTQVYALIQIGFLIG